MSYLLPAYSLEHGERYGLLTVLHRVESKRAGVNKYLCGCACGARITVRRSKLMKGKVKSCGNCTP